MSCYATQNPSTSESKHMESIEVIVAHREPTQPVERRVVIAPVNRRVVVAVQVPPAVVRAQKNREKQRRWYERHRC